LGLEGGLGLKEPGFELVVVVVAVGWNWMADY
jgi:hypothetical protein